MKKTEKKAEKTTKKSGKKKNAKAGGSYEFNSKELQKEFNKKMKVLVQEVKKDTEKAIKVLMKEAKEKIHAGSEFVRHDVLKSMVAQYEHVAEKVEDVLGIEHGEHKPAAKEAPPKAATRTQTSTAHSGTTRRQAASRARTSTTNSDTAPASRTRKTVPPMTAASQGEGHAA